MVDHRALLYGLLVAVLTAPFLPGPAVAQTVQVQNGSILQIQNGTTVNLEGGTMDLGAAGSTARLREGFSSRVTGGILRATRVLNKPDQANPAGLGVFIDASVDLGEVKIVRGHTAQTANGNQSITRYYDIKPSKNNSNLSNAELLVRYREAELNGLSEDNLVFFKSTDGGSTWSEKGQSSRSSTDNFVRLSGIKSFSRWTLGSTSTPLPVELAGFEATVRQSSSGPAETSVRLQWQVTSETRNAGFAVERRASGDRQWSKVGFVDSKAPGGTSTEATTYRFTDAELPYAADTLRYRLRQIDTDGTSHYSDVVSVHRSVSSVTLLATYPNPARQQATVRFAVPGRTQVTARLYNILGRRVRTVVNGIREGRSVTRLDVSDLSSGVYFLRLRANGTTTTRRLTVIR